MLLFWVLALSSPLWLFWFCSDFILYWFYDWRSNYMIFSFISCVFFINSIILLLLFSLLLLLLSLCKLVEPVVVAGWFIPNKRLLLFPKFRLPSRCRGRLDCWEGGWLEYLFTEFDIWNKFPLPFYVLLALPIFWLL